MLTRMAGAVWLGLVLVMLGSAPLAAQERPGRGPITEAAQAWAIIDSNDAKELETFIKHFGETFYGDLARVKLEKLEKLAKAAPPKGESGGIEGRYEVRGVNPNGSSYRGEVTIRADKSRYAFNWRISNSQTFYGTGTLVGTTISVDWGQKYPVIYKVGSDGVLRGKWENGRATEDLIPWASAGLRN